MVYTKDDPRSALTTTAKSPPKDTRVAAPGYFDFSTTAPDVVTDAGTVQWVVRGQNFVLVHTQPVVVPPGTSELTATGTGAITLLMQSDETAWAERAANADDYREPHPQVAPLEPWPEPVGGYRWRTYRLADVPDTPGRFGRIFRTRAFMVNFIKPVQGPRDLRRMSPHFHDDFEQASLVVAGDYVHHIQTPWGSDGTQWRPEDHVRVGSPSVTIIPPPTVHTSQAIGWSTNHLIDIFAGPRADFSAQPGWVLNEDEYPAPPA